MQDPRLARALELAPQVADEDVDDVGLDVGRVAPHEREQLVAGEHLARVADEDVEQVELAAGERELAARARRDVAARVDDDVARHVRARALLAAAAQQRLQARGQLGDRERLDEVVVGARLQPGDAVLDLVARGQHADGDVDPVAAQPAHDADAVEARHRDVEHDHRRLVLRHGGERLHTVVGGGHGEALEAERALEGLPDGGLVVDDEDQRFATGHAFHDEAWPR